MQFYDVAKIITTHGLKGELKVALITDFPEKRFARGVKLALKDNIDLVLTVEDSRIFKQFWLVKFQEINNIQDAKKLLQKTLVIAKKDQHSLPEGTYYYRDIIGSKVVDFTSNEDLGTVTDIQALGPNDVWQVTEKDGQEYLIPYISQVVKKVDPKNKCVYVTLMAGLRNED